MHILNCIANADSLVLLQSPAATLAGGGGAVLDVKCSPTSDQAILLVREGAGAEVWRREDVVCFYYMVTGRLLCFVVASPVCVSRLMGILNG
jgi:hypothetical protein